ncbi:MAG: DNA methyltransferase [Cytophagales bacterium]|nr:DNA methyltransferase [Cytophagales bacterium]
MNKKTSAKDSQVVNWENRTLFHGDNLNFMRGMNSESVDLIATDPPFNKNKDFHATPDSLAAGASFQDRWSWQDDVHQEWVDQIEDDHPALMHAIESARHAHSEGMGAYLCFMGVRLLEMHRLLKPTGSIYLHCDPTASHYLKAIMDAIFGEKNFRNEIVWCYTGPGSPGMRQFNRKSDTIFWYSKGKEWVFNKDEIRIPYKDPNQSLRRAMSSTGSFTKEEIEVNRKKGKIPENWWSSFALAVRSKKENTGYPTQKPIKLLERIIKASSNEGDIVLDPFCGCATTCVAAERLNRQWVGIDIWKKSHALIVKRAESEAGLLGKVYYSKKAPKRTDKGDTAAVYLQVKKSVPKEPPGPKKSRAEMLEILLTEKGTKCLGCDRKFDDPRYLQLDHNTPRADGGLNHISNRILLCGPCNRLKSNMLTLSGLRKENKKRGYMANN